MRDLWRDAQQVLPHLPVGTVSADKMRELRLKRIVFAHERIELGIRYLGRVLGVVEAIVLRDFLLQAASAGWRLRLPTCRTGCSCGLQQPFCLRTGFVCHLRAGKHPRDFPFHGARHAQLAHARACDSAFGRLGDHEVRGTPRRDLRAMRDNEKLRA